MDIDIISYTDAQFAALTEEQILEVKSAQLKKEKLDLQLDEDILEEKRRLIDNGIFLSNIWELCKAKLQAEHDLEVENLRDSLLFYLQFAARSEESKWEDVGYVVDYSLSMADRFIRVRDYYMNNYSDAEARFSAFKADEVAVQYLGERYATLYDYLLSFT